ncbi:hypothetical protein YC2023_091211 [Brassica napus]
MADQEDQHTGETPENRSQKDTGLESEDKRQDPRAEEVKEVEANPLNISDHDDKTRDDKLIEVTKTEALEFLLNAYKDVTSTMEKARVIQELTDHWKETKASIPPHVINPTRKRKGVDKFSDIDHRSFQCICGQRFYQQSNLTTHRKRCRYAETERIFKLVPKKMRSVFNIFCAPSDGSQRIKRQSKLRSAYNITEKSLPVSSSSNQRRAIESVQAAFKGSTTEERSLFIHSLREVWCFSTHSLRMKTREDAEIKHSRAQIDLSNLQREEILSQVGPAIALLKLKQDSFPPHVDVDEEEEA